MFGVALQWTHHPYAVQKCPNFPNTMVYFTIAQ